MRHTQGPLGDVLIAAAGCAKDYLASDEDPLATAAFSGAAFALRAAECRGDVLAYLRILAFTLAIAPSWLQPEARAALERLVAAGREVLEPTNAHEQTLNQQ